MRSSHQRPPPCSFYLTEHSLTLYPVRLPHFPISTVGTPSAVATATSPVPRTGPGTLCELTQDLSRKELNAYSGKHEHVLTTQ